ncbi:MAG: lipoyl(octanoyl) transferase LipB [Mariprofundales bacterium]|nr:lipoyl(octanoyl) transferase LipB [Mariprofundales bacterium]
MQSQLCTITHQQQPYPDSLQEQEERVNQIVAGRAPSTLILTEHPPTYTIGTSGSAKDILRQQIDGDEIAIFSTGRGGEVTYHGPGQLLCYLIIDLRRERDLHRHIWRLEEMVIRTLADFTIRAERDRRGIGVWVDSLKIAAAGVRCRKWVTWHGIALNINPNLRHFSGIVPCGMRDTPVTSMHHHLRNRACHLATRVEVEQRIQYHANQLFIDLQAEST